MKGFKEWLLTLPIITFKNILIYLIIINLLGFLIMLIDKKKAEKTKEKPWNKGHTNFGMSLCAVPERHFGTE